MDVEQINVQTAFMERMVSTYSNVHNKRYWDEIHPYISDFAGGVCLVNSTTYAGKSFITLRC
jgi:hypothetical protein